MPKLAIISLGKQAGPGCVIRSVALLVTGSPQRRLGPGGETRARKAAPPERGALAPLK